MLTLNGYGSLRAITAALDHADPTIPDTTRSRFNFVVHVPRIIGRRHLNLIRDAARDHRVKYSTIPMVGTWRTRAVGVIVDGAWVDIRAFADRVHRITHPEG